MHNADKCCAIKLLDKKLEETQERGARTSAGSNDKTFSRARSDVLREPVDPLRQN